MELNEIMDELKSHGTERTKKIYISNGAQEPVFGVTISAMKPIFKKIRYNQPLAEQLYATGNYDAVNLTRTNYWQCLIGYETRYTTSQTVLNMP